MDTGQGVAVHDLLQYIKQISADSNKLQGHKRRLAQSVKEVRDYIHCFASVDLNGKGTIGPKGLQTWLIQNKLYVDQAPSQIAMNYQDFLEALLPHSDYVLVSQTISRQPLKRQKKLTYETDRQRIDTLKLTAAYVVSQQLAILKSDYQMMGRVTRGSQRVGATLWRMIDHTHENCVDYPKIQYVGEQYGVEVKKHEWESFLYWHLHSYKQRINRQDFMRILDLHNQRKRAVSACKVHQINVQSQLWKRSQEQRQQQQRIQSAVKQKLAMMPHLSATSTAKIIQEQHFPFGVLNRKRILSGAVGYRRPTGHIKYIVQRES